MKDDLLFVAGQYGSDADGNVNTPGDHAGQARNALNRIKEICEVAGGGLGDVIDLTSFHQDPRWIDAVVEMYEEEFIDATDAAYPAWTTVSTPGLLKHGMLGQYRAVAELTGGARVGSTPAELGWGERKVAGAAKKAGGRLIGVTGVVPSGPDGEVVDRGDPEAQAHHCFKQLGSTLDGLGASLENVAQVSSYHLDPSSMDAALRVAGDYFPSSASPTWTVAGMTGFWREGELHCIQALAVT